MINTKMAKRLGVKVGDTIWQKLNNTNDIVALIDSYNEEFAIPNNKPKIPRAAGHQNDSALL